MYRPNHRPDAPNDPITCNFIRYDNTVILATKLGKFGDFSHHFKTFEAFKP